MSLRRVNRARRFTTSLAGPVTRAGVGALVAGVVVLGGAPGAYAGTSAAGNGNPVVVFTMRDGRIAESSGLVASRRHAGVYWTHNDSGDGPYVFAVSAKTGRTLARVRLAGVAARDMEAISMGPDGDVYVGDIGDNLNGAWPHVWIYRFPEPRTLSAEMTVTPTVYTVQYADGPRNAEALMIDPRTGRAYIASKNENGGHLYAGPARLSASGTNVFRRIADVPLWITDGAFSPDGSRLVLRGYLGALEYRWADGKPSHRTHLDVPLQPQGESVAFTPDGTALMMGSEGDDSEVWREPLTGAALPASVLRKEASTSGSGSPSASAGGKGGGVAGGGASHGKRTLGLVVGVVLALSVLISTRRRLGGSGSRRR
jgi:hypothetical protein